MFEILSFISESSTSSEQAEKETRHPTIDVCQATNKKYAFRTSGKRILVPRAGFEELNGAEMG